MTTAQALAVDRTYRRQIDALRTTLTQRLEAQWGDAVDPDNIADSVQAYIDRVTPTIEAGQATAQALATAYIGSYVSLRTGQPYEPLDPDEALIGTTRDGLPLTEGMAAIGPMVLGRIADGVSLQDALDTGRYLAGRFADNEVTGIVDRETDRQREAAPFTGWEGIIAPDACERCQVNAGEHDLGEDLYRHPGCNCDRRFTTG